MRLFRSLRCRPSPALVLAFVATAAQGQTPPRYFISVDMEGIGGIGTPAMTRADGKDYAVGRRLMTGEVNAVVEAIFRLGTATILVNDSHGDMQNLLHTELDPRVTYIQGNVKPLGMVEGLDSSFTAAFFLGYHARAGSPGGFLAHTGSGAVKGLWLNGREVGEGELNAAFAAAMGVPVVLAAGDSVFVDQFTRTVDAVGVVTKVAVTPQSARLRHPNLVRRQLQAAVQEALGQLDRYRTDRYRVTPPVVVRMRFADTTRPDVLLAIPGVRSVDGYTVEFNAPDMPSAYRLIRLMYKYVSV